MFSYCLVIVWKYCFHIVKTIVHVYCFEYCCHCFAYCMFIVFLYCSLFIVHHIVSYYCLYCFSCTILFHLLLLLFQCIVLFLLFILLFWILFVLLYIVILFVLLYIVILFVLLYIVNNSCYNIVTYCFGGYNIVQLSKINTSPCRPAPMGPNFQTHVYEPLLELHGDLWAQGATFGRDRPLRRQLLLPYHPCLAYRSQPSGCSDGPENGRSARRPTWQPRGQISASEDHIWRRYTPHETCAFIGAAREGS